jgi:hypothetical protein
VLAEFQSKEGTLSRPAKPITFGPGSLESIQLQRRHRNAVLSPESASQQARVVGTYRVYCGNGSEHTVSIDGPWAVVSWDRSNHPGDTGHNFTDADGLAAELVEWELEDWSDPCENGE